MTWRMLLRCHGGGETHDERLRKEKVRAEGKWLQTTRLFAYKSSSEAPESLHPFLVLWIAFNSTRFSIVGSFRFYCSSGGGEGEGRAGVRFPMLHRRLLFFFSIITTNSDVGRFLEFGRDDRGREMRGSPGSPLIGGSRSPCRPFRGI